MKLYRFLAYLIAVLVVVQAGALAWAFFGMTNWITDDGGVVNKALLECEDCDQQFTAEWGFAIHMFFNGLVLIPLTSLVLLIVSFFAKVPGGVRWAGFVVLAVLLQFILAIVAFEVPVIGALHGINALAVAGLASAAARRAKTASTVEQAEPAAA